MKNKLFLSAIIIICFSYAIVASYLMIVKNKSPHTIECVGRKVSKDKIYALTFSNRSNQGDTVMLYLSGKNFFVQGLLAKWMYMSLHLMHHRAILGTGKTAVLALARLLQQRVSGRMKLH